MIIASQYSLFSEQGQHGSDRAKRWSERTRMGPGDITLIKLFLDPDKSLNFPFFFFFNFYFFGGALQCIGPSYISSSFYF